MRKQRENTNLNPGLRSFVSHSIRRMYVPHEIRLICMNKHTNSYDMVGGGGSEQNLYVDIKTYHRTYYF